MTKRKAIYPGTFDPITNGHLDIIKRAFQLFDEVYIAVAKNTEKQPLFSFEERIQFVKQATRQMKGVRVEGFNGLVVEYAREKRVRILLRGLRATSDFDYEFQMALTNRKLAPKTETIFLMPSETYFYISSRLIKEISRLRGNIKSFVPSFVAKALKEKL